MHSTDKYLSVFCANGLSEALNGSFLTVSCLSERSQLTLHFIQLLLQLLQMQTNADINLRCRDIEHIYS